MNETLLRSAHRHLRDPVGGTDPRSIEDQIVPHGVQVLEHVQDVGDNGHLGHRLGELAILYPDAHRAHGEVPGDYVGGLAEDGHDIQAILNPGDDLLGRRLTPLEIEIVGPDAGVDSERSKITIRTGNLIRGKLKPHHGLERIFTWLPGMVRLTLSQILS